MCSQMVKSAPNYPAWQKGKRRPPELAHAEAEIVWLFCEVQIGSVSFVEYIWQKTFGQIICWNRQNSLSSAITDTYITERNQSQMGQQCFGEPQLAAATSHGVIMEIEL